MHLNSFEKGSDLIQLFNLARSIRDLEQLECDHGHNIESLDLNVEEIASALDDLSHLVSDSIDIRMSNTNNLTLMTESSTSRYF